MSENDIEYPIILDLKKTVRITSGIYHSQTIVYHCKEVQVVKSNGSKYSKLVSSDGEVAILYSPGYGTGWSTEVNSEISLENREQLVKDSRLVQFVLSPYFKNNFSIGSHNPSDYIKQYITLLLEDWSKDDIPSFLGLYKLRVELIPEGTKFRINEYDGSESIEIYNPNNYYTA